MRSEKSHQEAGGRGFDSRHLHEIFLPLTWTSVQVSLLFDFEQDLDNVRRAIKETKVSYPVARRAAKLQRATIVLKGSAEPRRDMR